MTHLARSPLLAISLAGVLAASAAAQCPVHDLVASDGKKNQSFGRAVALDGGRALVGAPGGPQAVQAGAAYLFEAATGVELLRFTPSTSNTQDRFGFSVALGEGLAVVGARQADVTGVDSGAAYVFDASTGAELFELTGSLTTDGSWFGDHVAVAGGRIAVAASWDASVHVFDAATGQELHVLQGGQFFGSSVALTADWLAVGEFVFGADDRGKVRVHDPATGALLHEFVGGEAEGRFGISCDLDGDLLVVGAYAEDPFGVDRAGAAYVFDLSTGELVRSLISDDAELLDSSGVAVAIDAPRVAVGSSGNDFHAPYGGAVYVWDLTSGEPVGKFGLPDSVVGANFGNAVDLAGDLVLAGAPGADPLGPESGSAHLVRVETGYPGVPYCGPGAANSTGASGTLRAWGHDVAADDCLAFEARSLPPGEFGYLLVSDTQGFVANPGGSDGNLCLSGTIGRFTQGIRKVGGGGAVWFPAGLAELPPPLNVGVQAGDTWNFQVWHRDGAGSNFTAGLAVTFL